MTRRGDIRLCLFFALALLPCASSAGDAAPTCRKQTPPALTQLKDAMSRGRFVSYQPTSLQIVDGRATHASEASIADDLRVLRGRFDGLITYGALNGAERIADVAATMGFRAVIVGVWDISNSEEIANAVAAWRRHPGLVVGISLGNEIVFGKRGTFESILRVLQAVRADAQGVLLTTSEPFHLFYDGEAAAMLAVVRAGAERKCGPVRRQRRRSARADLLWSDSRQGDRRTDCTGRRRVFAVTSGGFLSNTARRICIDTDARVRVFCRVRRTLAGRRQPSGAGLPSRRRPLGVVR
jgi:hypothetical protein